MPSFRATIALLGINPYVTLRAAHLRALLTSAGRDTGAIPIRVELGGVAFTQNLVKYQGAWRLYLNGPMRKAAGKDVGERVALSVEYDPAPRVEPMPPALERALADDPLVQREFAALAGSRQKEIMRYLNRAKTDVTLTRNVDKVTAFLRGEAPAGLAVLSSRSALPRGKKARAKNARAGKGRAKKALAKKARAGKGRAKKSGVTEGLAKKSR